ncbi:hypothetical protein AKO1_007066 [Acrasis kona]|uniref:Uncharacterized protein n=1 Tax=Acrasis kona TaxID=1008807 RepID=A0AAW2YVQ2_9EUKA
MEFDDDESMIFDQPSSYQQLSQVSNESQATLNVTINVHNSLDNMVNKIVQDDAAHDAFYSLLLQKSDDKGKILYDHLNKMINNESSIINVFNTIQSILCSECEWIETLHKKSHNKNKKDSIKKQQEYIERLDQSFHDAHERICHVLDVLSVLVSESDQLMNICVGINPSKAHSINNKEKKASMWEASGYFSHNTQKYPHVLYKQEQNNRQHIDHQTFLSNDTLLDDYDNHYQIHVDIRGTTSTPSLTMTCSDGSMIKCIVDLLSKHKILYHNKPVMMRMLHLIQQTACACVMDLTSVKNRNSNGNNSVNNITNGHVQEDSLNVFEPLISQQVYKNLLFGDAQVDVAVKSSVLDTLFQLLHSDRIMTGCRMVPTQGGRPLLDRITAFLNMHVCDDKHQEILFKHKIIVLYSHIAFTMARGVKMLLHDDDNDNDVRMYNVLPDGLTLLLRKELDELQYDHQDSELVRDRTQLITDVIRMLSVLGRNRSLKTSFLHDLKSVHNNLCLRSRDNGKEFYDKINFTFDLEFLKLRA